MYEKVAKEIEAYHLLTKLLEQADEVRKRFIAAGLPLPPPLMRLAGESTGDHIIANSLGDVSGLQRPDIATDDWIAIKRNDLVVQDLVLAIVRSIGKPVRQKEVCDKVVELGATSVPGSVYNVFPRLQDHLLRHLDDDTWGLIDPEKAPLIQNDYAWGPPDIFHDYSIAAYRRCNVLEALKKMPSGLTAMQLIDSLRNCGVSVDKDKIKADMLSLQKQGLVKRGFQKKWSVIDEKQGD